MADQRQDDTHDLGAPGAPRGPGDRSLIERLWRGRATAGGPSAATAPLAPVQVFRIQNARKLAAVADYCASLSAPSRLGAPFVALSLYREAAYWALRAHSPEAGETDLAGAFESCPEDVVSEAAGGAPGDVRAALVDRTFVDAAYEPWAHQLEGVQVARAFVEALLLPLEAPRMREASARWERWSRWLVLAACVLMLTAVGANAAMKSLRGPDLAWAKRWRASSAFPGLEASGVTDMPHPGLPLVHTAKEDGPWFEIDLGAPTVVRRVDVRNRKDCCQERTVPLVLEVSDDGETWAELGRRSEVFFGTWKVTFAPRRVRYVRLRVPHLTFLHLDGVSVY